MNVEIRFGPRHKNDAGNIEGEVAGLSALVLHQTQHQGKALKLLKLISHNLYIMLKRSEVHVQ